MPVLPSNSQWTVERVEKLVTCIAKKMSGGETARLMDMTTNQVVGKAYRLGLNFKKKPGHPFTPRKSINLRPFTYRPAPPVAPVEVIEPSEFLGLTFQELDRGQCKYPHGDSPYLFCGQPAEGPYCNFHHRLCYHKITPGARRYA